jgi:hypothetical protein
MIKDAIVQRREWALPSRLQTALWEVSSALRADLQILGAGRPLLGPGTINRLVCCASDGITRQWKTERGVEPANSRIIPGTPGADFFLLTLAYCSFSAYSLNGVWSFPLLALR